MSISNAKCAVDEIFSRGFNVSQVECISYLERLTTILTVFVIVVLSRYEL